MRPQWKTIFVTGGAGYIASHCIVELLQDGYEVIAVDNFVNSVDENGDAISLKRVREITGKSVTFYKCDLIDIEKLDSIFSKVPTILTSDLGLGTRISTHFSLHFSTPSIV